MSPMHDEQTLVAAYVLGALDPDERRILESHVANCPACGDELRSLQRVADALARAVPQRTPPPELRSRVLGATIGHTRNANVSAESRRFGGGRAWLPVAAAVVLAASLGIYAWQLQGRVMRLEARLGQAERRASVAERATLDARSTADQAQSAMAVLAAADLVRIDLAGEPPARQAIGRALWSRNRGMVFTATNLPVAPAGRVYQVWVVTATAAVSAGLLTTDPSGRAAVFFNTPVDIAPPVAVAVTLEPAGGVPAPTGAKYLIGTPTL